MCNAAEATVCDPHSESHLSSRQPLNGTTGSPNALENVVFTELQNVPLVQSHGSRYHLQVVRFYKQSADYQSERLQLYNTSKLN